jgi:4-aminobutyrate aminotransferase/(S)-3-amino-2-methylpropionate transaminase
MPISACLGRQEVFEAWPKSAGEALHTQTFLGHPVSCAAALASLELMESLGLPERSWDLGRRTLERLTTALEPCDGVREIRGRGLMIGIECSTPALALETTQRLLEAGYVLLPSGEGGRVVSLTPPLVIGERALFDACDTLAEHLIETCRRSQAVS